MLRHICDDEKLLLILDEIYTGFNRTGRLFACEHFDITPDIICLGKALSGGFPISACVGRADIMDAWPRSTGEALHTSTTLGNPLGCAMALASIAEHLKDETRLLARRADGNSDNPSSPSILLRSATFVVSAPCWALNS
jgi:acetylornithine/succinyldiaminopimelate/putrescine aminotransferase